MRKTEFSFTWKTTATGEFFADLLALKMTLHGIKLNIIVLRVFGS
jgi:hypothetical protein